MMIELIESTPDTVITLVSGKKYVVQESTNDVVSRMTEYYKKIGIAGVIAAQVGDDHLE